MGIERYIEQHCQRKRTKKRDSYNAGQPDWKKTRCTYCGNQVSYVPKQDFKGRLNCPHCGKEFRIPCIRARST